MTDEEKKVETESEEEATPTSDKLLRLLAGMCEEAGYGFGITLHVKGFIVSGITIPYTSFVEEFMQTLRASFEGGGNAEMATAMEGALNRAKEQWVEEAESGKPLPPPNYIHLHKVQFFLPGSLGFPNPVSETSPWRIRLDAVDGFTLGIFTTQMA